MRDSNKINVFLFCATQPIIEASTRVYFGSYQLHYSGIEDHFHKANLNSAKPNWKDIYDFTPVEYEENWNFIKTDKITEYISEPKLEDTKNKLVKCEHSWSHLDKSAGDKCFDEF